MQLKRIVFLVVMLLASLSLQAQSLVFGISPMGLNKDALDVSDPLQKWLSHEMAQEVVVRMYASIYDLVKAIQDREVHFAFINPFGYLLAAQQSDIQVLLMRGDAQHRVDLYHSCLVVPSTSPLHKLEDLLSYPGQYEVIFTSPTSTSGHLLPRLVLGQHNVQAEVYFKDIVFAGTHQAALEQLLLGKLALVACSCEFLEQHAAEYISAGVPYRVIWRSKGIPHGPIACQRSLPEPYKQAFANALRRMREKNASLWQQVANALWLDTEITLLEGSDNAFHYLSQLIQSDDELIFILNFYLSE